MTDQTASILQSKLHDAESSERDAWRRVGRETLAHETGDAEAGKRKAQAMKDAETASKRAAELREAIAVAADAAKQRRAASDAASAKAIEDAFRDDLLSLQTEAAMLDKAVNETIVPILENAHTLAQRVVLNGRHVCKSMGRSEAEIETQVQRFMAMMFASVAYRMRRFPGVKCPTPFLSEERAQWALYAPTAPEPKRAKG